MITSLLNLISTPVPVLNSAGLDLRVGLSSEDPTLLNRPTETYDSYLSIYSPEGIFLDRVHLGEIEPYRRRLFDISSITRDFVRELDHLVVVHRIPTRLLPGSGELDEPIEITDQLNFRMFRSLVEYSYPDGGNGSVIYETPPGLNSGLVSSSNTLTFTCQTVLSDFMDTLIILVHYSTNANYSHIADYDFGLYSRSGELLVSDRVTVAPFSIKVLRLSDIVPEEIVYDERDPADGLSVFSFVGCSDDASLLVMAVNISPSLRAVAVEHTHPPQAYLLPSDTSMRKEIKNMAQRNWKSIFHISRSN